MRSLHSAETTSLQAKVCALDATRSLPVAVIECPQWLGWLPLEYVADNLRTVDRASCLSSLAQAKD